MANLDSCLIHALSTINAALFLISEAIGMIHRLLSRLNHYFALCGCALLSFIAFFILLDVIGRKFGSPIPASVEIVKALMPAAIIVGFAYTQEQKMNISINIISMQLPPLIQAILEIISWIIGLIVALLISYEGFIFTIDAYNGNQIVEIVNIPLYLLKLFFIPGGVLLAIQCLTDIVNSSKKVYNQWK